MTVDSEANRFDDRLARMEATVRELQSVQADLRSGQWWLKWGGGTASVVLGIIIAVLVGVVVVNLDRNFSLTDQLTNVRVDTGNLTTSMSFVREDVSEIKSDVKALRADLGRVAEAVGAKMDEQKTELVPRSDSVQ